VTSFAAAHAAYKTVKSLLYAHSIDRLDKQDILSVELVQFHQKQGFELNSLWNKSCLHADINITFCLLFL
jgi:hypothetical protein